MMVLGICGAAGSGKTTLANLLVNCGWKRTSFSAGLKSMLAALLKYQGASDDLINAMLNGNLKEIPSSLLANRAPRHAMQTLGTEWRNLIYTNLWVEIWRNHINQTYQPLSMHKILVDDLRFRHEAKAIRDLDGKIIRIKRTRGEGSPSANPIVPTHISEIEGLTLEVDLEIINDSTPNKMLDQLAGAMEYWK